MTIVHKNVISTLLGCAFTYLFVWISSIVAALPTPEFLRAYSEFVVFYYSNILIIVFAAILSLIIMLAVRRAFTIFTKQNLFYFALPIVLFFSCLLVFLGLSFAYLLYAAIPTLLIAMLLTNGVQKTLH
jgi:hypothetical protein